jgi:hypothetical protein
MLSRNDKDMVDAVNAWCTDSAAAEKRFGHISEWNTSRVTSMEKLFKDRCNFNDYIGEWDVVVLLL